MSHFLKAFLKAGSAFALVALITGTVPPPSPQWQAADLHQATPQAKVKAAVSSLFQAGSLLHGGKG